MTIEELQSICEGLNGTTTDIKWDDHLCFNVGGKMYLVTTPDHVPQSASFKVDDEEFDAVSSREGCMPAPYMARYKWVHVDDISRFSLKEWKHFLTRSHHLVAAKLPAKTRKELGLV